MYTPTKARVPLQSQLNLHHMTFGQTTKHLKEIKIAINLSGIFPAFNTAFPNN